MEHGSADKAIKDMVTGAQEKGKAAATHADNLRDKFGSNLDGKHKGLTLDEALSANDSAKIDSQVGQALGTLANKAVGVDVMDSSQKASQQKGAVEGLREEAEKLGKGLKSAAQVLEDTAKTLSQGKLEKDVGTIEGAEKRGGYAAASFKAGVEGGAGMGAAYDNMAAMVGSDDPSKIAQTLKDRTSMTDTKRHLIEDIGAFGLDKFNKAMGTDFHSEGAAAVALMGGGAVAAEAFQLLRGQKGPIRTTVGAAKNGVVKAAESVGLIKSNPDNLGNSNNSSNGKQGDSPINQNDSTHDGTSSKNSDTIITKKRGSLRAIFPHLFLVNI